VKITVIGANGRMGSELPAAAKQMNLKLHSGVVRSGVANGYTKTFYNFDKELAAETDVLIDFSVPENMKAVTSFAAKYGIPLVSGVTGITKDHRKILQKTAAKVPVLWSANMSLGVAVLTEALKVFKAIEGFDFQIEEFHHNKKKDNPSGTALHLQSALEDIRAEKLNPPVGIRGGGIFGVHKVHAMSQEETLCFEHVALSRQVFAKGALRAALWLRSRKPGLYQMGDLLVL
jgi:4-hydroxy-tetrahydrodipicolinate reductase